MNPDARASLVASALAGLLSGSLAACKTSPEAPKPTPPAIEASTAPEAPAAPAAEATQPDATATQDQATPAVAPTDGSQPVKAAPHACKGLNECKGQGGCKTGDNGCKGKNSCKGKGGCASSMM